MIFPQMATERHYQVVERQFQVVERQTQVAERRSGPFRLNLTTGWVTICCLRVGKTSRYGTSHLGQLSLPSLRGT